MVLKFLERGDTEGKEFGSEPRFGLLVSVLTHLFVLIVLLFDPSLGDLLNIPQKADSQTVRVNEEKKDPLVLFMEEEPISSVPVVPAPAIIPDKTNPETVPQPLPSIDELMVIPKAMLAPERRAEIMNDLPYSAGNTDEFYTDEAVKDPGVKRESELPLSTGAGSERVDASDSEGELVSDALDEIASTERASELIDPSIAGGVEERRAASREPQPLGSPNRSTMDGEYISSETDLKPDTNELGEDGEEGRFTDIRRFLDGAQFHNLEGGLVANSDNTLYYNDKGANFVPWIRRMLAEISRTWRAGMPWAANIYAGHVAVGFTVDRSGNVLSFQTLVPSGVSGFDNIAVGAVRAADLLPLPSDYPDDKFDMIIVFWYNERPYDIFG